MIDATLGWIGRRASSLAVKVAPLFDVETSMRLRRPVTCTAVMPAAGKVASTPWPARTSRLVVPALLPPVTGELAEFDCRNQRIAQLALKEDGPPYALDPATLATRQLWDWNGQMTATTFTAHPKIDTMNGDLVGYSYAAKGEASPDCAFWTFDKSGRKTREVWFESPQPSMIHDCGLTENYLILVLIPQLMDLERIRRGGILFQWEPKAGGASSYSTCWVSGTWSALPLAGSVVISWQTDAGAPISSIARLLNSRRSRLRLMIG